jgi:hypothetical protein
MLILDLHPFLWAFHYGADVCVKGEIYERG